jgi:hypothetical protein
VGVKLDKTRWYGPVPKSAETNRESKVTMLWNQHVKSERTIPSNKPDTIIPDNEKGTCLLMTIPISRDRTVTKKEGEIILKYDDLPTEIQRICNEKNGRGNSNHRGNWNHLKNHSENISATNLESITSQNYWQHPYWALRTHFVKYECESTKHSTGDITLHVTQIVTTE